MSNCQKFLNWSVSADTTEAWIIEECGAEYGGTTSVRTDLDLSSGFTGTVAISERCKYTLFARNSCGEVERLCFCGEPDPPSRLGACEYYDGTPNVNHDPLNPPPIATCPDYTVNVSGFSGILAVLNGTYSIPCGAFETILVPGGFDPVSDDFHTWGPNSNPLANSGTLYSAGYIQFNNFCSGLTFTAASRHGTFPGFIGLGDTLCTIQRTLNVVAQTQNFLCFDRFVLCNDFTPGIPCPPFGFGDPLWTNFNAGPSDFVTNSSGDFNSCAAINIAPDLEHSAAAVVLTLV